MVDSTHHTPDSSENRDSTTGGIASLNPATVKNLMDILDHSYEGMYTCEETFFLLDEYVEIIANNEEAAALMPYVERHLEKCPGCHDVYAILLQILQSEPPATEPAN